MKRQFLALAAVLLGAALPAAAGVYKWVDKNGKTHYGDRPPPEEVAKVEEVNRSGVPLALQERLRGLDSKFIIVKISGNLDVAYVCGEFSQEDYGHEPRFPFLLEQARLGKTRGQQDRSYEDHVYNEQATRMQALYSSQYGSRSYERPKLRPEGRCPPRQVTGDMQRRLYEIRFNADAVSAYRTAPD